MLPYIKGTILPAHFWSSFTFERVLQYYDGPRLLLQKNQAGQIFLAWWSDSDETTERWIYLPISEPRLHSVLSGVISSHEALREPEDGFLLVIDRNVDDQGIETVLTDLDALPEDAFPLPHAKLSIPVPEEISGIPSRGRAHLLDVRLEGNPTDETGRVGASIVGQFIGNLQRLLHALGQVKEGHPTQRGVISSTVQSMTRLDIIGGYVGSFGVRFETHAEDDMLGNSLVRDSLASLFDLFEAGYEEHRLTNQLVFLKGRVAKNYSDLLSTIESSIPSAFINWSQPGRLLPREALISQASARSILAQIEAATDIIEENLEIEGVLLGGNVRTLRFEIREDSTDERFEGTVDERALDQLELITLGSQCRVILQPHLQVIAATGEQRTTYTLLDIALPTALNENFQSTA